MFSCYECRIKDISCIYNYSFQYISQIYYCKECYDKRHGPVRQELDNNI